MTEPKYDEDVVNLGYLKKIVSETEENFNQISEGISKHYASKPNPPYHAGDTWIDGNIVYTCVNSRKIGLYVDSDWVTESGAKEEAEKKSKVFLRQPSDYNVGDMWILQSDTDHRAGKKGEILITTVGRTGYNENDWVNMLSYGNIASINEVLNDLNIAISDLCFGDEEKQEGTIVTYYSNAIPEANEKDLWYVIGTIGEYEEGSLYQYDGVAWIKIDDGKTVETFRKANEQTLVSDGKINSFYTTEEPTENVGVGDLWINTSDGNVYRYNGTNWVTIYATKVSEIIKELKTITERTVNISTDLGKITQTVSETETRLNNDYLTAEQIEAENETLKDGLEIIKQQQASMDLTSKGLQIQIDTINNEGVKTVKNTTVDIDENGVTVGKSDSEFSTTMNNTGTYMYAYGKQIAKYDKDGTETADFKATGEVELGFLKIIKGTTNNEKRTHIHFIG